MPDSQKATERQTELGRKKGGGKREREKHRIDGREERQRGRRRGEGK